MKDDLNEEQQRVSIEMAQLMANPQALASLMSSPQAQAATVGVRAIWVHAQHRRKGVASTLLDALRAVVLPGAVVLPRNGIAFSPPTPQGRALADLAASFQQAAIDSILAKLALALDRTGCRVLAIGGGVTANTLLRESVERLGRSRGVDVLIPPRSLCTDNAAMGAIAWERLERGENDGLTLDVLPGTDRSAARR
jgi:predicted NodU family carbamoyl transferase